MVVIGTQSKERDELLELLRAVVLQVKEKRDLTREEMALLLEEAGVIRIPVSIFSSRLAPLEALVKYLKDEKNMSYSDIAKILNRNYRSIWTSCKMAARKSENDIIAMSDVFVPVSVFADRRLSVLEHLVIYLKDSMKMRVKEMSLILNKRPGTLWATYHNAKVKMNTWTKN